MSLHTISIIHEKHGNCQVKNILTQGGWPESSIFPSGSFHFNSQPRKGADTRSLTTAPSSSHFNSQPRKGADWQPELKGNVPSISTHSPARGLTIASGDKAERIAFQLTAPQGDWRWCPRLSGPHVLFQLTAPQGDWLSPQILPACRTYFNSQPRKGTDSNFSQKYCLAKIVFCIYFTYFY